MQRPLSLSVTPPWWRARRSGGRLCLLLLGIAFYLTTVAPAKAEQSGFRFFYEGVEDSLRFQLGKTD